MWANAHLTVAHMKRFQPQLGRVEEMVFAARRSYASAVFEVVILSVTRVLCD